MGMTLKEIRELIRLVDKTDFEEVKVEYEDTKVILRKVAEQEASSAPVTTTATVQQPVPFVAQPQPVQTPPTPVQEVQTQTPASTSTEEEDPTLHKIVSPMVGTFYRAPSPEADPYVKEGDQVNPSTVVCIVEAMKLMNEIEAETKGTIVKILVENGQLVEYGQPLFLVKTI